MPELILLTPENRLQLALKRAISADKAFTETLRQIAIDFVNREAKAAERLNPGDIAVYTSDFLGMAIRALRGKDFSDKKREHLEWQERRYGSEASRKDAIEKLNKADAKGLFRFFGIVAKQKIR